MKRVLCLSLALILCFSLIGCGENSHEGEVKTPAGSSDMEGRNYEDVVTIFEEKGFTNIKTEPIDDLIFGWLTKDGEVEEVSVGGDVKYSENKWVAADIEVVIRYHTFPGNDIEESKPTEVETNPTLSTEPSTAPSTKPSTEPAIPEKPVVEESNITIDNNTEFAALMKITDQTDAVTIRSFANSHKGKVVEFDGCVAFMMQHENYKTRFDVCLAGGDYTGRVYGPLFSFEDVNFYEMNVSGSDTVAGGMLFRIAGEIRGFNEEGGYVILEPVFMKAR